MADRSDAAVPAANAGPERAPRAPCGHRRALRQVLRGVASYDGLPTREQAIVRAAWQHQIEALRGSLNYERAFIASGDSYSEADEKGDVIIRPGGGSTGPTGGVPGG